MAFWGSPQSLHMAACWVGETWGVGCEHGEEAEEVVGWALAPQGSPWQHTGLSLWVTSRHLCQSKNMVTSGFQKVGLADTEDGGEGM